MAKEYLRTTCPSCEEMFLDTFACCEVTAPMIEDPPYYRIVCGNCGEVYIVDRKKLTTRREK